MHSPKYIFLKKKKTHSENSQKVIFYRYDSLLQNQEEKAKFWGLRIEEKR